MDQNRFATVQQKDERSTHDSTPQSSDRICLLSRPMPMVTGDILLQRMLYHGYPSFGTIRLDLLNVSAMANLHFVSGYHELARSVLPINHNDSSNRHWCIKELMQFGPDQQIDWLNCLKNYNSFCLLLALPHGYLYTNILDQSSKLAYFKTYFEKNYASGSIAVYDVDSRISHLVHISAPTPIICSYLSQVASDFQSLIASRPYLTVTIFKV